MVLCDSEETTMSECLHAYKLLLQPVVVLGEWAVHGALKHHKPMPRVAPVYQFDDLGLVWM